METVHIAPGGEYERYEELLFMRDRYEKEAELYQMAYIRAFGELITESFQLKIECIALKKEIALYVKARNAGKAVSEEDVRRLLEKQMSGYYHELDELIRQKEQSRASGTVSNYEADQIK